jgi:hypothetical protein
MNEIKKGDWVYAEDGGDHVFQCYGTMYGLVDGGDNWWHEEYCYRLEPLTPDCHLELGDLVAVINRSSNADPELGTIHRVTGFSQCGDLKINFAASRLWTMLSEQLARLPDCAQDKRCDPVKEVNEINEIKKGDWVYTQEDGLVDHVFQCAGVSDGCIIDNSDIITLYLSPIHCHRLKPLKPGDKLSPGDRVAVVARYGEDDPKLLGTIHRIIMSPTDELECPIIDFTACGWAMLISELARLPDCAQDKRCETSDGKETQCADDDDQPIPYVLTGLTMEAPCQHPEWEGIWLDKKEVRRVKWCPDDSELPWGVGTIKSGRFAVNFYSSRWVGPKSEGWTMLEPAPRESIAGQKLERPNKHGEIKTPWDPWEI